MRNNTGGGGINEGSAIENTHTPFDHSADSGVRSPGFHSPLSQASFVETFCLPPVLSREDALLHNSGLVIRERQGYVAKAHTPKKKFGLWWGMRSHQKQMCGATYPPTDPPPTVATVGTHRRQSTRVIQCALCAQERRVPAPPRIYRPCTCVSSVLSGEGVRRDCPTERAFFPGCPFRKTACVVGAYFVACTWGTANERVRETNELPPQRCSTRGLINRFICFPNFFIFR